MKKAIKKASPAAKKTNGKESGLIIPKRLKAGDAVLAYYEKKDNPGIDKDLLGTFYGVVQKLNSKEIVIEFGEPNEEKEIVLINLSTCQDETFKSKVSKIEKTEMAKEPEENEPAEGELIYE